MKISGYASFVTLQEKNLPFYIASIGHPRYQTVVHRPTGIEDYQLLYTLGGSGHCFINGNTYELKAGRMAFLPPHVPHEYHSMSHNWETLYITFHGSGMNGFFNFEPAVWTVPKGFDFSAWYHKLYALKQQPQCYKQTSIALYAMLLELKDYTEPVSAAARKKMHLLTRALHRMTEDTAVSLRDIVQDLHVSEAYFCRIFKEYTGFRPFEYINLLKIQKAKELLKNSDLDIREIAAQAGYESHSYFSMLFKRCTGMTPTDYRTGG